MKKFLLISFVLLVAAKNFAQNITVSGHVYLQNIFPFEMMDVTVTGQDGLLYYAVTDVNGFYSVAVNGTSSFTTVEVQVIDLCTNALIIKNVPVVNNAAVADFTICSDGAPSTVCYTSVWYETTQPFTYNFHAAPGNYDGTIPDNASYLWDFGDGTTSIEQNPTHVYPLDSWYGVKLTTTAVTDTIDCVSYSYLTINTHPPYTGPTKTVTVSGYVYNDLDSSIISNWVIFSLNTIQQFNQAVANSDSSGFYSFSMDIPYSSDSIQVSTFTCEGSIIYHTVYLVNNVGTSDFYTCTTGFQNNNCYSTINYQQTDSLQYEFSANAWSAFENDQVAQYQWDFGDGTSSAEASPTHIYADDNIYNVTLMTVNLGGCVALAYDFICTYNNGSIDSFYYGCQAMFFVTNPNQNDLYTFNFEDNSFSNGVSWLWDFGDGNTSTEQNPTHTYQNNGFYDVTFSVTSTTGCESTITMGMYVGSYTWNEWGCQAMYLPVPNGNPNGFLFYDFSSSPSQIQSWAWDFGDGNTSTEQNPSHTYVQSGIYSVSLSIESIDSCSSIISFDLDTENPLMFNESGNIVPVLGLNSLVTNSTRDLDNFGKIELFPNPTSSDITVKMNIQSEQELEISISDVAGKRILTKNQSINAGEQTVNLDVNDLIPGVYFLQMRSEKGAKSLKFVKI
jgi:PKD repeat protein